MVHCELGYVFAHQIKHLVIVRANQQLFQNLVCVPCPNMKEPTTARIYKPEPEHIYMPFVWVKMYGQKSSLQS